MAEVHLATVDDGRHEANDAGQRNANEQDLEKASIERELWASRRARGCELQHSFLAEPRSAVSAKAWVTLVKKCQTTVPVATHATALESGTKLLLTPSRRAYPPGPLRYNQLPKRSAGSQNKCVSVWCTCRAKITPPSGGRRLAGNRMTNKSWERILNSLDTFTPISWQHLLAASKATPC